MGMRSAALAVARAARGFMPEDEGLALHAAGCRAAASGLGPIVEIGTYCAKSAVYLGEAARLEGAVVVSVDHHRGSEENQAGWEHHDGDLVDARSGRLDTLPSARRTLEEADLERHVILVVGESTAVAALWRRPLCLLFIDGGHGSDVAWGDYRAWTPHVAPGGWLAIHDVFADPSDGGQVPYDLYREALRSEFSEDQDAGCASLRVLRRKPHAGP